MAYTVVRTNSFQSAPAVTRKTIGFVAFDGVSPLDIVGPLNAFVKARGADCSEGGCYEVVTVGVAGKRIMSESGLLLTAQCTLANAPEFDTIVVPGGTGLSGETRTTIAAWLTERAADTRRIVSVSNGIFAVAAAGLLNGRTVATHWRYTRELAREFPAIQINPSASFLRDDRFFSCGGGTASVEMTLLLIEEDFGRRTALDVAKDLVVRLRPAGENNHSFDPQDYDNDPADRLMELPSWIAAHVRENLSVEVLAERCCVCPRHFSRVFKSVFGRTPAHFVEELRLAEARRRLQSPRETVESVATAVGFRSADAFRRAFERRVGMPPSRFRRAAKAGLHQNAFSGGELAAA